MNISTTLTNPQTAPRSIEELSNVGLFQLRLLVDKLGGLQTAEQKQAFAGLAMDDKVKLAHQLLAVWDRNGGALPALQAITGAHGEEASVPAMNAAMPTVQMGDAMTQMSVPALQSLAVAVVPTGNLEGIHAVGAMLKDTRKGPSMREDVAQLKTISSETFGVLASLDARLTDLQRSANVAIALCLLVGEHTLKTSKHHLVEAAVAEIPAIYPLLQVWG